MNLFERYLDAKQKMAEAKSTMEAAQIELYTHYNDQLNFDTGTVNFEESGFKIKISKKELVSVDQKLASVVGLGFKVKYDLDRASYKKLTEEDQKRVDECLTTKPAKPTFVVERMEE